MRLGKTLRELEADSGLSNAYLCQLEGSSDRLLAISWVNLQKVIKAYKLDVKEASSRLCAAAKKAGSLP